MAKRDKALDEAKAILKGTVCRCAHLESEHYADSQAACAVCGCAEFKAVRFKVERA